jgi:hypothetical protein
MTNDPNIIDLTFPMDGLVVTYVDPWFVNAYGTTFMGTTAEEAMNAADEYGELHQLRAVSLIAFQLKEAA